MWIHLGCLKRWIWNSVFLFRWQRKAQTYLAVEWGNRVHSLYWWGIRNFSGFFYINEGQDIPIQFKNPKSVIMLCSFYFSDPFVRSSYLVPESSHMLSNCWPANFWWFCGQVFVWWWVSILSGSLWVHLRQSLSQTKYRNSKPAFYCRYLAYKIRLALHEYHFVPVIHMFRGQLLSFLGVECERKFTENE